MCNVAVIEFFVESVEREEFEGKRVLEVGSKYVNGSVRPLIERFLKPKRVRGRRHRAWEVRRCSPTS